MLSLQIGNGVKIHLKTLIYGIYIKLLQAHFALYKFGRPAVESLMLHSVCVIYGDVNAKQTENFTVSKIRYFLFYLKNINMEAVRLCKRSDFAAAFRHALRFEDVTLYVVDL